MEPLYQRIESLEIAAKYSRSRSPASRATQERHEARITSTRLRQPNAASRRLSARLYPNGEFGVGCIPPEKKRAEDVRQERGIIYETEFSEVGRPHELEDGTVLHDVTDKVQLPSLILGQASELSQVAKTPSRRYGQNGISGNGKRVVRNIAYMMEQSFGLGYLQFATLTIPSFDPALEQYVCSNWHLLVKKFFQECKRWHRRARKPWRYVSVTEIQPNRWREYKQVGLHIHFLYRAYKNPKTREWIMRDDLVAKLWHRILQNLIARYICEVKESPDSIYCPVPNYDRKPVEKSAAAYLGKYMSKSGYILQEVKEQRPDIILPSQWWSADIKSRADLKRATICDRGMVAFALHTWCHTGNKAMVAFASPVEIESRMGGTLTIGWSGRLTAEGQSLALRYRCG